MHEAQAFSIHVASANSLYDRPDFLASLEAQTDRCYQVIYVDLGTGKLATVSDFEAVRPDVVRLRTFRNIGFVRGQNQAIALALSRWPRELWSERFVVISRPEVAFDRRLCEAFLRAFREDPQLMVAGPKVFWADAIPQTEGDWIEIQCTDQLHSAGIGLTRSRTLRFLGQGSQDTGQFDEGKSVLCLSDACVVIRASALASLALGDGIWLDPRLPPFFSVMDLCLRAAWQGFRARLVPDARVWLAPQDRVRHKRVGWRETYVPSKMRTTTDDILLRIVHAPWVVISCLRYGLSRIFFGRFWEERLRPDVEGAKSPSGLKFLRKTDRAVPLAERRRWFLP